VTLPTDHDRTLVRLVCPPDWRNRPPRNVYDLVVLGGGTAGLVSAVGAAGLGAQVAIVERKRLGGDCLNTGCVPSKALLRTARAAADVRRAAAFGVRGVDGVTVDFQAALRRMRECRSGLAAHDSAERLTALGIDVFFGEARFLGPRDVGVGSHTLRFVRAVLATGSRPAIPPITGLGHAPYLTSDTIFDLTARPDHLLIIGAGAMGCELAQAFARMGSRVTVFDALPRVLGAGDPDASLLVRRALEDDGVRFELGTTVSSVTLRDGAIPGECRHSGGQGRPRHRRSSAHQQSARVCGR
jgi:pyruvate/2-oxoglutarate dehydrogenase complex dihydrolipoamide dehydrogenase (E3) component